MEELTQAHALLSANGVPEGQSLISRLQWLLDKSVIVDFDIETDTILTSLTNLVTELNTHVTTTTL